MKLSEKLIKTGRCVSMAECRRVIHSGLLEVNGTKVKEDITVTGEDHIVIGNRNESQK